MGVSFFLRRFLQTFIEHKKSSNCFQIVLPRCLQENLTEKCKCAHKFLVNTSNRRLINMSTSDIF